MAPFDRVVLIFNPNSTGDAKDKAAELRGRALRPGAAAAVELAATQHAGHARDLARDAARRGRPLLVSVSGDGGYNEVVDGVMASGSRAGGVRGPGGRQRQRPPPHHPASGRWPTRSWPAT